MKALKKLAKYSGIFILAIVVLVAVYIGTAYILSRISTEKEVESAEDVTIYVYTNGVHTDIVVPVKTDQIDWSKDVKFENTFSKDTTANFLALGWGDKGFYLETPTWGDLKFSTAFRAAFWLSSSAIHATFYRSMPEGNDCKKITLSKKQYGRLIAYIQNSFARDANGMVMYIKTNANYNDNDAFYEANGKYNLFHTCNTWTNNGLKSCGQKAAYWTPFDTGIFYHYPTE